MTSILCQLCQTVPFHDLPQFLDESYFRSNSGQPNLHAMHRDTLEEVPILFGFHHHPDLESLRRASTSGCELCRLIEIEADALLVDISERNLKYSQFPEVLARLDACDPSFDLWITKRPKGGDGFWVVAKSASAPEELLFLVATFGFCSEDGTSVVPKQPYCSFV
jgi:hypothetical protein